MKKIKTIFERDWEGDKRVINQFVDGFSPDILIGAKATEAVKNTSVINVPDGEWSGEALGPNIQGNPLGLEANFVALFSLGYVPNFDDVPTDYDGLKPYLSTKQSGVGKGLIEGIVWHCTNGDMYKIKGKDFSGDNRN